LKLALIFRTQEAA